MAISNYIALGVMNSIKKLYSRREIEDFVIDIENTEIKCHRFILASCSEFFCGLFRSGMKEVTDGRAPLHGISCETFHLILEAIYTASDVITEDNVIAIWHASNLLQIDFMIELCEKTVVKMLSLDNFEEVYRAAKLINSKHVLGAIKKFILEHFVQVRKMNTFLELSYDELLALIRDNKLVVESEDQVLESIMEWIEYPDIDEPEEEDHQNTDTVTEERRETNEAIAPSVVEETTLFNLQSKENHERSIDYCTGVENISSSETGDTDDGKMTRAPSDCNDACVRQTSQINNNVAYDVHNQNDGKMDSVAVEVKGLRNVKQKYSEERLSKLAPLLNVARTCLASSTFLESLYKHHLINGNREAKEIIFNAVLYHTENYRNGNWSTAALHRDCSASGNFGVFCYGKGIFEAYSIAEDKYFDITSCPECILSVHLVVFDNELYACGRTSRDDVNSELFLFRGDRWIKVTEVQGTRILLLSYEYMIVVLNIDAKIINFMTPKEMYRLQEKYSLLPEDGVVEHALVYENKLLVFLSKNVGGVEQTSVHGLDLITKIWTRLDNLEGPANYLISFQDGENNYIIQRNGNVWRLMRTKDKRVSFHFIGKLWTSDRVLYGAVHYKNELILFEDNPDNYPEDGEFHLPEFPYSLFHVGQDGACSNFVPVILDKSCLTQRRDFYDTNKMSVHGRLVLKPFHGDGRSTKYRILN